MYNGSPRLAPEIQNCRLWCEVYNALLLQQLGTFYHFTRVPHIHFYAAVYVAARDLFELRCQNLRLKTVLKFENKTDIKLF